ncbi:hypothetical protein SAMN05444483_103103 [Salegentibacter echinorum]|uniref:Uncharacterized protein n=1 Tax=Salegentibacter echinorum TaxID=1073325 RepID=A0A1M5FAK3_SALEC|nr:hypothetical protein [Salegentibacter echinorum]SHF88640.1 hypothetical protein SAMN05444483_103103 [Salegentibacter echinorum]
MEKIRCYLAFIVVLLLLIAGCSEEREGLENKDDSAEYITLEFGAMLNELVNQEMSKNYFSEVPNCDNGAAPLVARLTLNINGGTNKTIEVTILSNGTNFYTDYSEELEIPVAVSDDGDDSNDFSTVNLSEFLIYDGDPNTNGNLIWVAPTGEGELAGYVENPLPLDIIVRPGTKKYVEVEVLCFDRRMLKEYGYMFFDLIPEKLYELCFFANYCDSSGRHYPGSYGLDLFLEDEQGFRTQLYNSSLTMTEVAQNDDGDYFAKALCLVVPGPPAGVADDEEYLFYSVVPKDWEMVYGDIDNAVMEEEGLSWNDIKGLFNDDGETSEYMHIFINCKEDTSECGEFEAISETPYAGLIPKDPVDYFEIVNYLDGIIYSFSQGELCLEAEDEEACIEQFNNLIPEGGFVISCLPAGCYTFIRHQTAGVNELVTTDEELLEFLGSIDSKADALLLALANDYYWTENDIENGAIKETCDGAYELIASKIVSSCVPLQISRFHLRITTSGEIIILDEQVIEYEENLCI